MPKPNHLGHQARKRFGQNFLVDHTIIDHIVQAIAPEQEDALVEIGPGFGALTQPLLKQAGRLTAIEIDRDVLAHLKASCEPHGELTVINTDVLKADWNAIFSKPETRYRVVGNLPYNISTPLLLLLMSQLSHIQDMHFMLQHEVIERMAAEPNTKAYGRLSVVLQAQCEITPLFQVPPESFNPPPKVMSGIVRLTPKANPLSSEIVKKLAHLCHLAFSQRRKQLRNTLGQQVSEEMMATCGITPNARAENITVAQYIALAEQFS